MNFDVQQMGFLLVKRMVHEPWMPEGYVSFWF